MEIAVSRMSIRNLRVYAMHDVDGFRLVNSKYFADLTQLPEEFVSRRKNSTHSTNLEPQTPSRVPVDSYSFFPSFAALFIGSWTVFRFIFKVELITVSSDVLFALMTVVFYIGRDCAQPWQRKVTQSLTPTRKRADASLFEEDCQNLEIGVGAFGEGSIEELPVPGSNSDESWKRFEGVTTVQRLLNPGVVLRTHEEFAAAFAASGINKWVNPPGDVFWLRGKNYLEDKQKYQSAPGYFPLIGCDLWKVVPTIEGGAGPQCRLGRHPQSYVQKVLRNPSIDPVASALVHSGGEIHIFVMNFLLPFGNFVGYFLRPHHGAVQDELGPLSESDEEGSPEGAAINSMTGDVVDDQVQMSSSDKLTRDLYDAFIDGDDAYRNARLKVSPRVFAGPWLVKRAVGKGNRAAKLGEQIPLSYDRGPHHFEVMVDVSSSALGNRILSVVTTYIQSVTIDLGFLIEGTTEEELPERILGALRFYALDVEGAPYLPPMNFDDDDGA